MSDFFRVYKATQSAVPAFFIESTAPNNVDDTVPSNVAGVAGQLEPIDDPDKAIAQIADALAEKRSANLVVMVHGFNNPRPNVLEMYARAAAAINGDPALRNAGAVCVGYRWPSERMWGIFPSSFTAAPPVVTAILLCSLVLLLPALQNWLFPNYLSSLPGFISAALDFLRTANFVHATSVIALGCFILICMLIVLRACVYYRDVYRAINYGVPDLIQIIRSIDSAIVERRGRRSRRRHVQLSFIGHSMGGLVVTNTIRTLSDVFAGAPAPLKQFGARGFKKQPKRGMSDIGHVFVLKRFILASPDIPAEHLLSSRSNFLASSLTRFKEAYLFSNEGDEVLRLISTLANFFMFPTRTRAHGYRLGNVEVLSRQLGIVSNANLLRKLRIGKRTLEQLYAKIQRDAQTRQAASEKLGAPGTTARQRKLPKAPLAAIFSYFDCTDYRDSDGSGRPARGLLTFAKLLKRLNAAARLRWYSHAWLLIRYSMPLKKGPNVHGGYFEGEFTQQLIYRLACLGYVDTKDAFGGKPALSAICAEKQIRVLLSPNL